MGMIEDVVSELEGIGAIGDKVVLLKQPLKAVPAVQPEPEMEEDTEMPPEEPEIDTALRERVSALALKADEKLARVIEAVQDLRGVFQELHEATTGDPHAEISEEA